MSDEGASTEYLLVSLAVVFFAVVFFMLFVSSGYILKVNNSIQTILGG